MNANYLTITKTNDNEVEVRMVYGQLMFKGFQGILSQSQEQIKKIQKNTSKINRIGRRLLNISKNELFKFNSKVDFSIQ
ncbi:BppA, partial (plasmid) [Borrelia miyamotoi]